MGRSEYWGNRLQDCGDLKMDEYINITAEIETLQYLRTKTEFGHHVAVSGK